MSRIYTLATYEVREGAEAEFEAAQRAVQDSALSMESPAISGVVLRRVDRPSSYISFGVWRTRDDAVAWRESKGFAEAFGRVTDLCDDVIAGPCEIVLEA